MRVAGMKHYSGADSVQAGKHLSLSREPANEYDADAVAIETEVGAKVGYVPRQYSRLIAGLLDGGASLHAKAVRRLLGTEEGGRWVVRIER